MAASAALALNLDIESLPEDAGSRMPDNDGAPILRKRTFREVETIRLLREFANSDSCPSLSVRVAGGWVRDLIMMVPSDDIDVATERCSGLVFAQAFVKFLSEKGMSVRKPAEIKANPDKSKHLDTAKVEIPELRMSIDCVELRGENYGRETRVPAETWAGSPREDAERRDFTINALFYNVKTGEMEDFLGTAFVDIRDGILRTPKEAALTFGDDPIRIMRAGRFLARYPRFLPNRELVDGARSQDVQEKWRKLSTDRQRGELEKLFHRPGASRALRYYGSWQILPLLFKLNSAQIKLAQVADKAQDILVEHIARQTGPIDDLAHFDDGLNLACIMDKLFEVLRSAGKEAAAPFISEDNVFWDIELFYKSSYEHYMVVQLAALLHHQYGWKTECPELAKGNRSVTAPEVMVRFGLGAKKIGEWLMGMFELLVAAVPIVLKVVDHKSVDKATYADYLRIISQETHQHTTHVANYWEMALLLASGLVHLRFGGETKLESILEVVGNIRKDMFEVHRLRGVWSVPQLLNAADLRRMGIANSDFSKYIKLQKRWLAHRWVEDRNELEKLRPELEEFLKQYKV